MKIPKELADALGTPQDPIAIYRAAFRKLTSPLRELLTRAAQRAKVTHVDTPSQADPKRKHRISLVPKASDSPDELGLRFAMFARKVPNGPEILLDEARRMAMGLRRGLEGDPPVDTSLLPPMHPHAARFLEGGSRSFIEGIPLPTPTDVLALTVAILPILVPVLIAAIPFVLPMLIDAGNLLFETIGANVKIPGITGPSAEEEAAARAAALKAEQDSKRKRMFLIAGAVVAVVLVGVAYYRSRQAG